MAMVRRGSMRRRAKRSSMLVLSRHKLGQFGYMAEIEKLTGKLSKYNGLHVKPKAIASQPGKYLIELWVCRSGRASSTEVRNEVSDRVQLVLEAKNLQPMKDAVELAEHAAKLLQDDTSGPKNHIGMTNNRSSVSVALRRMKQEFSAAAATLGE